MSRRVCWCSHSILSSAVPSLGIRVSTRVTWSLRFNTLSLSTLDGCLLGNKEKYPLILDELSKFHFDALASIKPFSSWWGFKCTNTTFTVVGWTHCTPWVDFVGQFVLRMSDIHWPWTHCKSSRVNKPRITLY